MEEINVLDFFNTLLKKIWIILLTGLVFSIGILIYDEYIKVPMYESSATLVLTKNELSTDSTINQNDINMNKNLVYTYSELAKSKLVLNQTIKNLKLNETVKSLSKLVKIDNIENTEILKISVKYNNPKLSKEITNELAKVFSKEIVNIYKMNNVSIIDAATLPKYVCNNTLIKDIIISFIAGSFLTILIIFVIYYFDDTIKITDDIEEELEMPIIGKIINQKYDNKNRIKETELIVEKYPKSLVSEGIKSLRTNLSFSSIDSEIKSILVTSSMPGEGKSFISSNLAIAFAQSGKKVLLIDCDMRKGRLFKIFKISNIIGLSNLLLDSLTNYKKYIKETDIRNLSVLTNGTIPPNPSELLGSLKYKQLVEFLKQKFDILIFDGVPCNGLPDSVILSTLVDKTLIVSSERNTPRELLENTKKSLEKVDSNIAGLVVNKINSKTNKYYGSYYSYGDE